jgi:hypothetical protein
MCLRLRFSFLYIADFSTIMHAKSHKDIDHLLKENYGM